MHRRRPLIDFAALGGEQEEADGEKEERRAYHAEESAGKAERKNRVDDQRVDRAARKAVQKIEHQRQRYQHRVDRIADFVLRAVFPAYYHAEDRK